MRCMVDFHCVGLFIKFHFIFLTNAFLTSGLEVWITSLLLVTSRFHTCTSFSQSCLHQVGLLGFWGFFKATIIMLHYRHFQMASFYISFETLIKINHPYGDWKESFWRTILAQLVVCFVFSRCYMSFKLKGTIESAEKPADGILWGKQGYRSLLRKVEQ